MRLRETAGPSEHFVPRGVGGFVRPLSRTERKHWTRLARGSWVELLGAGEEDVAVGQVEGAGVAEVRVVAGQEPGRPGRQVDLVDVAEGLLDEQDPLAVVREVGPLAEEGQPGDVRREILVGRARRLVERLGGGRRNGQGQGSSAADWRSRHSWSAPR